MPSPDAPRPCPKGLLRKAKQAFIYEHFKTGDNYLGEGVKRGEDPFKKYYDQLERSKKFNYDVEEE